MTPGWRRHEQHIAWELADILGIPVEPLPALLDHLRRYVADAEMAKTVEATRQAELRQVFWHRSPLRNAA